VKSPKKIRHSPRLAKFLLQLKCLAIFENFSSYEENKLHHLPTKMNTAIAFSFFAAVSLGLGDTLRLSEVADEASDSTEQITFSREGANHVIIVKKALIIGDADVNLAVPNYGLDNDFYVELTDDGAKKIKEATAKMNHGQDRLAIIVEGRLVSAPVVQSPLGGSFIISGLEDLGPREIDDLARKMSGRPPRPAGVEPMPAVPKTADGEELSPILPVVYPEMDPSAKGFDRVAFVEAIEISNPKGKVNIRDLGGLISTTIELLKVLNANSPPEPTIAANCDFILALAHNFTDVASLTKKPTQGRISLQSLNDAMSPYIKGDKPWPIKSPESK
jgi:hypothetical protein